MWLTGRLTPDFKTIADFRRDNGLAIRQVCRQFITLCRKLDLFSPSIIAIDGSKFKAVSSRDRNFTSGKLKARVAQVEESIDRYLAAIGTADRTEVDVTEGRIPRLTEKIAKLKSQMQDLKVIEQRLGVSAEVILTQGGCGVKLGLVKQQVPDACDARWGCVNPARS